MTITKYCVYIVYIVRAECLFFYNYYYTKSLEGLDFLSFFMSITSAAVLFVQMFHSPLHIIKCSFASDVIL